MLQRCCKHHSSKRSSATSAFILAPAKTNWYLGARKYDQKLLSTGYLLIGGCISHVAVWAFGTFLMNVQRLPSLEALLVASKPSILPYSAWWCRGALRMEPRQTQWMENRSLMFCKISQSCQCPANPSVCSLMHLQGTAPSFASLIVKKAPGRVQGNVRSYSLHWWISGWGTFHWNHIVTGTYQANACLRPIGCRDSPSTS